MDVEILDSLFGVGPVWPAQTRGYKKANKTENKNAHVYKKYINVYTPLCSIHLMYRYRYRYNFLNPLEGETPLLKQHSSSGKHRI